MSSGSIYSDASEAAESDMGRGFETSVCHDETRLARMSVTTCGILGAALGAVTGGFLGFIVKLSR
jgi:hypothetical protein